MTPDHIRALLAAGPAAMLVRTSEGAVQVNERVPAGGMRLLEHDELLDALDDEPDPRSDQAIANMAEDVTQQLAEHWFEAGYDDLK